MKSAVFLIFLLSVSLVGMSQTTETKYYRNLGSEDEVPQGKAKYSRAITEEDGITTTTTTNLRKNRVEHRQAWKGDEPVGIWVVLTGKGPEEIDYDFDLVYEKRECTNTEALAGVADFFKSDQATGYTAPEVDYKEPELSSFIVHTLKYPAKARRHGTQGVVELVFTITAEGSIKDIVVTKGVDLVLDKEAVRVFRKLKLARPPLLNGEPREVCVALPISFQLR